MKKLGIFAVSLIAFLMTNQASWATNTLSPEQTKKILFMTKPNWVAFRNYNGQQLIYFTHLEAWKCGIKQVRYGLNGEALDKSWTLETCNPDQPNAVTKERPYLSFPLQSIKSIDVELTFSDGTQSEAVRFNAP